MASAAPLLLLGGAALLLMSGKKKSASSKGGATTSNAQGSTSSVEPHTGNGGSVDLPDVEHHGSSSDDAGGGYWDDDGDNPIWVPDGDIPDPSWLPEHGEGSRYAGLWEQRQLKLYDLGYRDTESKYVADGILGDRTVKLIRSFQMDWNWFVGYLEQINPNGDYEAPYTKIAEDGFWGPGTDSRINKAIGKFNGTDLIYVEELGYSVKTFRDMISGLKGR